MSLIYPTIGTEVIKSPQEMFYQIKAILTRAIVSWVNHMLAYLETNKVITPTDPLDRPKGKIPVNEGNLLRSAQSVVTSSSVQGLVASFNVGFSAPYAQYIDQDRLPGSKPPVGALMAWKGLTEAAAEKLAWSIYHRGWDGYEFAEPFYREGLRFWRTALEQAFRDKNVKFKWVGQGQIEVPT